ncbi:hypothetical protein RvY_14590 [Ramazzottius varieornatus]|uniref:Glutamyl-tRNA(Gln) amidotransferase subunit B, mitochondrial n=1 Tax=Ramazzottius varieornatus TaxID=947166 RepID=A0A1D1VRU1_RAMVA|nr:hypothetical protein RvY_14590 [Ramazzottius varieornatus]
MILCLQIARQCRRYLHTYPLLQGTRNRPPKGQKSDAQAEPKQQTDGWSGVIGLEIHAQIKSKSKLFSGSGTEFSAPSNTQVSLFDCATPGTLPVLNRRCVEAAVKTAFALNCTINPVSLFDRKHYFYADLPTGYQITQRYKPIAASGWMEYVQVVNKQPHKHIVNIEQIQLEQDSGKSIHNPQDNNSLIDLNRAGIGLMEIITKPDFTSGEQAAAFVRELVLILKVLHVCDVRMFEGSLRVDANISVHRKGEPLGVRSEVKNLASMKFISKAIDYEISRQVKILEKGEKVVNETRGFDLKTGRTYPMRDKEILQDYRYMPEPNLPPLRLFNSENSQIVPQGQVDIAVVKKELPELPSVKRTRYLEEFKLFPIHAAMIVADERLSSLFDAAVPMAKNSTPQNVSTLIMNGLVGILNTANLSESAEEIPVKPKDFALLTDMLSEEKVPRSIVLNILQDLVKDGSGSTDVAKVIEDNKWYQINDEAELGALCDRVIAEDSESLEAIKAGRMKAFNALMAKVKTLSKDLANMKLTKGIMEKKLEIKATKD